MGKKSRKDFAFHVCMQLNDLLLRFNIALFFFNDLFDHSDYAIDFAIKRENNHYCL